MDAFGQGEIAVLLAGDFDLAFEQVGGHGDEGLFAAEGLIEGAGEQAAFEAGGAEQSLLGESDALEGEQLLGVDGLVGGNEVGLEVGEFVERFETNDGEGGGGEPVLAGVLGGAGLAFGAAGAGGLRGIGAVGGQLAVGEGRAWTRHRRRFLLLPQ